MRKETIKERIPSSFRDPSGFLFRNGETIFRQINEAYKDHFDHLIDSGLYDALVRSKLLIPHEESDIEPVGGDAYKIIKPERVPFISYPYEWCFSQLKDAALTTLKIQRIALDHGMILKDASAYNIQFVNCKPVLIDTLSFEIYKDGEPWVAYRQFCQHFLAPLALMSLKDVRLSRLLRLFIDGVPLDLASSLLPARSRLKVGLLIHLHFHSRAQARYADKLIDKEAIKAKWMSKQALLGFVNSLESSIAQLSWEPGGTEWGDYYGSKHNYSAEALEHKKEIVDSFIEQAKPESVWDLGANTGLFSRLASQRGIPTIAFDMDPAAVERNYVECKARGRSNLLPLVLDLANPSPSIGWSCEERMSLLDRGPADMVLALALVHHLAISNNVPLERIAKFFSRLCKWLVIEFIPKEDEQVQRLLAVRKDIFENYAGKSFYDNFSRHFSFTCGQEIKNSNRSLFLLKRKNEQT